MTRLDRIKAKIITGEYDDTDQKKLEAVVDGVLADITREPDKPATRFAVFLDEEDGTEVVLHSRASMRQLTLDFGPNDEMLRLISIDENMKDEVEVLHADPVGDDHYWIRSLREAIEWLEP